MQKSFWARLRALSLVLAAVLAPVLVAADATDSKFAHWCPMTISFGPVGDQSAGGQFKLSGEGGDAGRLIFYSRTERAKIAAITLVIRGYLPAQSTKISLVDRASGAEVATAAFSKEQNSPRLALGDPLLLPASSEHRDFSKEYLVRISSLKLSDSGTLGLSLWKVEGSCGKHEGVLPWVPLYDHIELAYGGR